MATWHIASPARAVSVALESGLATPSSRGRSPTSFGGRPPQSFPGWPSYLAFRAARTACTNRPATPPFDTPMEGGRMDPRGCGAEIRTVPIMGATVGRTAP
jgi:hypothetical protein